MKNSFINSRKLIPIANVIPPKIEERKEEVKRSNPLLDLIYAPDPVTGLPAGDLQFFLSDDANPQVRQFIEANLMQDFSSVDSSDLSLPDSVVNQFKGVISDDDIQRFARNDGESVEEYSKRMHDYFEESRRQAKFERDYQRALAKLNSQS